MIKNTGGCQCGAVRFVVSGEPTRAMACHCTACKLRTGGPYGIGVYFKESSVIFESGELNTYQFNSDTSGRWIRNHFCINCGSTVSWTFEKQPDFRGISGGCFDDPNWYKLDAHVWTRSARTDMCYPEGMNLFEMAIK